MANYRVVGVELGTLDMRSRELDCHRWDGIDSAPTKRGANRPIRGQRGRAARVRVADELTGRLHIWVRGRWDGSTPRAGGPSDWASAAETTLGTLLAVLDADDPLTLTLHRHGGGTLTGSCQVEDPGPVSWPLPHLAHLVVAVTLPDGRLT